nr:zinc finger BED domain-containing protein 4-like [Onthophagus taurus]
MTTSDFQPFTIVRDVGFKKLVTRLDPRYKLPTPYMLNNILEEEYLSECTKLKTELSKVDFIGTTSDSWTSIATESNLTVTCHYMDENLKLKTRVLPTKPLRNGLDHTSENLAETLTT